MSKPQFAGLNTHRLQKEDTGSWYNAEFAEERRTGSCPADMVNAKVQRPQHHWSSLLAHLLMVGAPVESPQKVNEGHLFGACRAATRDDQMKILALTCRAAGKSVDKADDGCLACDTTTKTAMPALQMTCSALHFSP